MRVLVQYRPDAMYNTRIRNVFCQASKCVPSMAFVHVNVFANAFAWRAESVRNACVIRSIWVVQYDHLSEMLLCVLYILTQDWELYGACDGGRLEDAQYAVLRGANPNSKVVNLHAAIPFSVIYVQCC